MEAKESQAGLTDYPNLGNQFPFPTGYFLNHPLTRSGRSFESQKRRVYLGFIWNAVKVTLTFVSVLGHAIRGRLKFRHLLVYPSYAIRTLFTWLVDDLYSAQVHEGIVGDMQEREELAAAEHKAALQTLCNAANSGRPFVLYLRDFGLEAETYSSENMSGPGRDNMTSISAEGYHINRALADFDRQGSPIITLANPADMLHRNQNKLARIFVSHDSWRDAVSKLIDICPVILLAIGRCGPGVQWELATLVQRGRQNHTIVMYPEGGIYRTHDDAALKHDVKANGVPPSEDIVVRQIVAVFKKADRDRITTTSNELVGLIGEFKYTTSSQSLARDLKNIVPTLFNEYLLTAPSKGNSAHEIRKESHEERVAHFSKLARWAQDCGNLNAALEFCEQLLSEQRMSIGTDHPDTITTRSHIAILLQEHGDLDRSLELHYDLLADKERIFGPGSIEALVERANIATANLSARMTDRALEICEDLLRDYQGLLDPDNPLALGVRATIAACIAESGDVERAYDLFSRLLMDQERILGADAPETLTSRHNIAIITCKIGNPNEGLRLLQSLLIDRERVLGPQHPETLATHVNIAYLVKQLQSTSAALDVFRSLLPHQERTFGFDHPSTLRTMQEIAELTAECDNQRLQSRTQGLPPAYPPQASSS